MNDRDFVVTKDVLFNVDPAGVLCVKGDYALVRTEVDSVACLEKHAKALSQKGPYRRFFPNLDTDTPKVYYLSSRPDTPYEKAQIVTVEYGVLGEWVPSAGFGTVWKAVPSTELPLVTIMKVMNLVYYDSPDKAKVVSAPRHELFEAARKSLESHAIRSTQTRKVSHA